MGRLLNELQHDLLNGAQIDSESARAGRLASLRFELYNYLNFKESRTQIIKTIAGTLSKVLQDEIGNRVTLKNIKSSMGYLDLSRDQKTTLLKILETATFKNYYSKVNGKENINGDEEKDTSQIAA